MQAGGAMRLVMAAAMVVVFSPAASLGERAIHRLAKTVLPTSYKINMDTRFLDDNFTFHGEEWIDFTVMESTSNLSLHSKGLLIDEDQVDLFPLPEGQNASEGVSAASPFNSSSMVHSMDKSRDLLTFVLDSPLEKGGRYRLHLGFAGQLSKTMTGYYRESYLDQQDNTTRWLASTTFEPTDARRAFPCFDEPGLKARFQINLARQEESSALSNMPLGNTTPMEGRTGWVWDHFQESPPMPTYLVAFYVGPLRSEETSSQGSATPFKVWARPEALPYTKVAAKMGSELLRALSSLTAVDNPLPKQDVLALPAFVTDALENWGLISFGEKYLLHQPGITSAILQEKSAFILAHELAHNWFGNMVGIKWWSDIWMSEGFATYYAALAVDQVRPEWDSHTTFVGKALMRVLSLDSLRTSHPLTFHVNKTEELRRIFDPITYLKGYYVLRMLSHFLGEDTFLKCNTRFLRSHMFGTANPGELWQHLTAQAHEDDALPSNTTLRQLMEPWSLDPGYPVITVLRDYDEGTAAVSQERFVREEGDTESRARSSGGGGKLRPASRRPAGWWVPVTFTTQARLQFNDTRPAGWLRPSDSHLTLRRLPADQWVLLNLQAAGLYRVQYDDRNWRLLAKFLDSDQYRSVHVLNRVQIVDDVLNLARAGQLSYPITLDVLTYILREDHALPWKAAFDNLAYVYKMVDGTEAGPAFKSWMLRLVSAQYERLGFLGGGEGSSGDPRAQLQGQQVRRWACALGHRQCVQEALRQLDDWANRPRPDADNPIAKELRSAVYCTGAEHGGNQRWRFLWQRYRGAAHRADRTALLAGLACSRDPAALRRLLEWSVQKDSGLRREDGAAVFKAVARTDVGHDAARLFLQRRAVDIARFAGANPFHVPLLIDALSSGVKQPEHLKELEDLIKQQQGAKPQSAKLSMQQAAEKARFNTQWLQRNLQPISSWLESRAERPTTPPAA